MCGFEWEGERNPTSAFILCARCYTRITNGPWGLYSGCVAARTSLALLPTCASPLQTPALPVCHADHMRILNMRNPCTTSSARHGASGLRPSESRSCPTFHARPRRQRGLTLCPACLHLWTSICTVVPSCYTIFFVLQSVWPCVPKRCPT